MEAGGSTLEEGVHVTVPQDLDGPSAGQSAPAPAAEWSYASRIAFRFLFAYVLIFLASYSAFYAPFTLPISVASRVFWEAVVSWVATHILLVTPPPLSSDGDGLGHWIQLGCCVVFAAVTTLIWSIADRRRRNYIHLATWLRVIVRYAVGIAMVVYGLAKIAHLQMLPPHLAKLVQPLSDSSPTSLLWILMGSSAAYSTFTGAVELLGGVLLFNRRTTTLGALISLGALVHAVVLNLSYDVSVKIWSMSLLALTLVLVVPDLRRVTDVFVLNRPSMPVVFPPLFRRPKHNRILFRVGMACLAITLALRVVGLANGRGSQYARTPTPIHGIYDVESFTLNGAALPPLLTDTRRWRTVVIERSGMASIRLMDDDITDYLTSVDDANGTVTFLANPDSTVTTAGATRWAYNPRLIENRFDQALKTTADAGVTLDFSTSDGGALTLHGQWGSDRIEVQMTRVDESEFLLLSRGFHWVQAYPFFR